MSRSGITLRSPGGAEVRCAAHKRYALAVGTMPHHTGKPRLKVLFRTNDADALLARSKREAKRLSRTTLVFSLRTGDYLGGHNPDGTVNPAPMGATA